MTLCWVTDTDLTGIDIGVAVDETVMTISIKSCVELKIELEMRGRVIDIDHDPGTSCAAAHVLCMRFSALLCPLAHFCVF